MTGEGRGFRPTAGDRIAARGSAWGRLAVVALGVVVALCTGCGSTALIEPGHRGLVFDPRHGGLQHDVLFPGYHRLARSARIDDYDVKYALKGESLHLITSEGLPIDLRVAISYRPIVAELYLLDTELGPNYYDEMIAPELRSAWLACLSRHSYADLSKENPRLEDEVELDMRKRLRGRHLEIASVLLQSVQLRAEACPPR